jgi:hypothetical protein
MAQPYGWAVLFVSARFWLALNWSLPVPSSAAREGCGEGGQGNALHGDGEKKWSVTETVSRIMGCQQGL